MSSRRALSLLRALDPAETLFWLFDRVSSMNFAIIAEGEGVLAREALQEALDRLQARHPLLRAGITRTDAGELAFFHSDAAIGLERGEVDTWLDDAIARRMVEPFGLDQGPLVRAHHFVNRPETWCLVLVFHHSIADGRAGCGLMLELLRDLAGDAREDGEVAGMALQALLDERWAGESGQARLDSLRAMRKAEFRATGRPSDQAGFQIRGEHFHPTFVRLHLAEAEVLALARVARRHGASVHGALGAAQLLALWRRFGGHDRRVLSLTSPVDLRPRLAGAGEGVSLLTSLLTVSVALDPGRSFWELAAALTSTLREQLARGDGEAFYRLMPSGAEHAASELGVASFATLWSTMPQASLLSNVGRIDASIESPTFALKHLSFALCPMPNQPVFSAVTTFNGAMTINLNYDAASWEPAAFAAFVHDVETGLKAALA